MVVTAWNAGVFADPRLMPEMRRGLLDLSAPGGTWTGAELTRILSEMVGNASGWQSDRPEIQQTDNAIVIGGPKGFDQEEIQRMLPVADERADKAMHWYRDSLEHAQLIHVSEDLSDILFASVDTVPHDTVLTEEMMPTTHGLVLFETPFIGIDSGEVYEQVRVDAVLWGNVRLPARDDVFGTEGVLPGVALAAFRWMDPRTQDDHAALQVRKQIADNGWDRRPGAWAPSWLPLGRSDWLFGDRIDRTTHDLIDPESKVHASMMEDRRSVVAHRLQAGR